MKDIHMSKEIKFVLEGNEIISFSNSFLTPRCLPTQAQLRKKIISMELSHPFYNECDLQVEKIAKAFDVGEDGIIKKIPNEFVLHTQDNIIILKSSSILVETYILEWTEVFGIVGCWDQTDIIICSSQEYKPIMENVIDFMQPQRAKFTLRPYRVGFSIWKDHIISSV